MPSTILLKAIGLNTSPNALDIAEGSLTEAENVVISRDNVIESRRGFKLYGDALGVTADRAKQLLKYKDRILVHYDTKIAFDDGSGDFTDFNGTFEEVDSGLRLRGTEANGNFLFTSSEGIKKISADSPSDFTSSAGYITQAGGIKALDFTANLNIEYGNQSSFFTQDSAVAYRTLWNTIDLNDGLVPGTPSQRVEVYNPITNLLIPDFMEVLHALDNIDQTGSLITDGNYVNTQKLAIGASATTLRTSLLALATKIDTDILYADDGGVAAPLNISGVVIAGTTCTVTCSAGAPQDYWSVGSKIYLAGFTDVGGLLINGAQTVVTAGVATMTFTTAAAGAVVHTGGTIVSNEYRSITQPATPSSPATNAELVALQDYLDLIITQLLDEPTAVISSVLSTAYIAPLDITTTASVNLKITIPEEVTTDYFLQVYRSAVVSATGTDVLTDLVPNDELQLVYEVYASTDNITAGFILIEDIVTDAFRGANLYTNNTTGEGILQSNDIPPLAKDISSFKGSTFYANTKTRHRMNLSLLGVSNMITDFGLGTIPTLVVTDGTTTNTYTFITGVQETTTIACDTALVSAAAAATYFRMYSAEDATEYYFWYKYGSATDPAPSPVAPATSNVGVPIYIPAGPTATVVAEQTRDAIATINRDFTATTGVPNAWTVTVVNVGVGVTTNASAGTSTFTVATSVAGTGEDVAAKKILLSTDTSPAIAVDETARSMVRVINQNDSESISAFYLSGASDVPGRMFLEARELNTERFYLLGNNSNTGLSFNPVLSPSKTITTNTLANPTVVNSTGHGLVDGDSVVIVKSNSTPSIDGLYAITYINANSFTIPVNVTVSGTSGSLIDAADAQFSDNDTKQNRVYYSKPQQPEAVPLLNYMDIGSEDQAILRIFPLRGSLFVFKEDGLYRISGESIPFSVELFDSSTILIAPDSLDVSNNNLYCWTQQGIVAVSESGVENVSRAIDTDILRLASSQFTNFSTVTWGVGYESDNSYLVFTVVSTDDDYAHVGYRYSTLTKSWTTYDKQNTCGVVNPVDDKLYLGAGESNYIEQERKDFTRLDFADYEIDDELAVGMYQNDGSTIEFAAVSDYAIGDVLYQNQYLTIFQYNALLLKLDIDTGVADTTYASLLTQEAACNMRTALADPSVTIGLAAKLDADLGITDTDYLDSIASKTGSITNTAAAVTVITSANHELQSGRIVTIAGSNCVPSINGTHVVTVTGASTFTIPVTVITAGSAGTFTTEDDDFRDMQACFNVIVNKLNNDTGVTFINYQESSETATQEAIITAVNYYTDKVTVNIQLPLILGPVQIFKAIPTTYTYAPIHMGDPLASKQVQRATLMFQNKAFTSATMSFSTDLLPEFMDVDFDGDGNGIFGYAEFGEGFFGGGSHQAPFSTFVPRQCQRCRFMIVKFSHTTARERYAVYGCTLTGRFGLSARAYR